MFWEIHVPKHKEETVFCFLSHDLVLGPTHEFEHINKTPANAQNVRQLLKVMKVITQEQESSKSVMTPLLWISQTLQELVVLKLTNTI